MECGDKRVGSSFRASCRGCKMGGGYSMGFKREIPRLPLGSLSGFSKSRDIDILISSSSIFSAGLVTIIHVLGTEQHLARVACGRLD